MAAFADIVFFRPTLGGTTDWVVDTAVPGYLPPVAGGAVDGLKYKYRAESADMSQWEVGEGTYSVATSTLSRGTILYNSAGDTSKIDFLSIPRVGIVALSEDIGDMKASKYDENSFASDAFGASVPFGTVADCDAAVLAAAPRQLEARFFDGSNTPGSRVLFDNAGTSDPTKEGQIDVTANGVTTFYTRSNLVLRPEQFGAKHGGNAADNRAALLSMFKVADQTGRTIDMGDASKVYSVSNALSYYWGTNKPVIRGSGATIKLDTGGSLFPSSAVTFAYDQIGFDLEGFCVDGNSQTPYCLDVQNINSSALNWSTIRDGRMVGVKVRNAYTRTSTEGGTRGIRVVGWLRNLYAEDLGAENIVIADGAYNINYTTAGIEVGRQTTSEYPIYKTIKNVSITNVLSEDADQTFNMDGMLVYDAIPSGITDIPVGATTVLGGHIKNSWGRGVKFQALNVDVIGLWGEQTTAPSSGRTECFLDFQFGNGNVVGGGYLARAVSTTNIIITQAFSYTTGPSVIRGFRYIGDNGTAQPESFAWNYANSDGANGGGILVRDCVSRITLVKNIVRSTTPNTSVPTERLSVNGCSLGVTGAGVAFEFRNAEQQAATFKDNFNWTTSLVPLYTKKFTDGSAASNTVSFVGTTGDNWYYS